MKKIIVFGIGRDLEIIMEARLLSKYEIVAFCCNDETKWDKTIYGKKIICPQEIQQQEYDYILICTRKYEKEIKEQLKSVYSISADKIRGSVLEDKLENELAYWKKRYISENKQLGNAHYRDLMLRIAQESDDNFLKEKIVADFGCGPRGSLAWMKAPKIKMGIDVLIPRYLEEFGDNLIVHDMVYVTSSEEYIPVPTETVDCLITINSLDHVSDLDIMCKELLRILKPNGLLLASFNLNELPNACEPQMLTEKVLQEHLLKYFNVETYRIAKKGPVETYSYFMENNLLEEAGNEIAILWVRATKK